MSLQTPPEALPGGRSLRQWQAYAAGRVAEGMPSPAILSEMIAAGVNVYQAEGMVAEAVGKRRRSAGVIIGCHGALLVVGTIVTLATLSEGSGYIWYGAIIVGLFGLIYGIVRWVSVR